MKHNGKTAWIVVLAAVGSAGGCSSWWPWNAGPRGAKEATPSAPAVDVVAGVVVAQDNRLRAGGILKDNGLFEAALQQFNRVLRSNPRSVDALLGVGSVQHAQERYAEARDTYARAVALDGERFEAHYFLGLMQQVLGETQAAIAQYQRALTLEADDPRLHRDLASAYLQAGRVGDALVHAERAVELDPASQAAWRNLATVHSILGQHEEALRGYRTATEIGDLDAPLLLGLGDTHLALGNLPRAVNTLEELVRLFPGAVAHERLAFALFRSRDFTRALDHYRRSLGHDARSTAALNGVGACLLTEYLQQENRRRRAKLFEALDAWRLSLQIDPDQPEVVELLAKYDLPD